MRPVAQTSKLGFAYGGSSRCVLNDVDLCINEGEFILVAGPSGGGKSTLLRCLNGLIPHFHGGTFRGRVHVGGLDTRTHQPRDLASVAGLVFQEPEAQSVARTVQEEIVFGLENRGAQAIVIRKRLEEVLDALGIASLRTREMRTLSGGERQRVAIAAILTMQPALILMDEPTSQLDPQAADDVLRLTRDLRDDYGRTIVIAEHRLERVALHADRVMHVHGNGSFECSSSREAMQMLPGAPSVSRIGQALGWSPLPLSIAQARSFVLDADRGATVTSVPAVAGDVIASVRGIRVELGGRPVLSIDHLDLRTGECLGLMGRNGAGKTTLLRTLAGLVHPATGTIDGPTAVESKRRYRELAFVPQDPGTTLYKPTLGSEIQDVIDGTRREGSVEAALAEWNVTDLRDADPRDLSVGERQRAALAALLVGRPRLILLDEPTRGMDAVARDLLVHNLRQRCRDGASVVLASHDVELVAAVADRVVLLAEGQVVADEPTRAALTGSVMFSTQTNKLFGGNVLTVEDAIGIATRRRA